MIEFLESLRAKRILWFVQESSKCDIINDNNNRLNPLKTWVILSSGDAPTNHFTILKPQNPGIGEFFCSSGTKHDGVSSSKILKVFIGTFVFF